MSTFLTFYVVSVIINLIVVRGMIYVKEWKPNAGNMFMVFAPFINVICAAFFLVCGFFAGLYWIANGTIDS